MVGTAANALTGLVLAGLFAKMYPSMPPPHRLAWAAGTTAAISTVLALAASFLLPEPKSDTLEE
jgi:hypothetical protein